MAPRIAAQLDTAVNPTGVTIPAFNIAYGILIQAWFRNLISSARLG